MCDFPVLPLAQALHLGDASRTEGGEMLEQKKPQNPLLTMVVNTVHADLCPFGHRPSQSAVSSTEPSSDRNTRRLGMGWIKDLLSQEWILSRQPAATFWHSKLSQILQANSSDPSFTRAKSCFGVSLAVPSRERCRPCSTHLLHPPVGPKGPPMPFTQSPIPPENPAFNTAVKERDIWSQDCAGEAAQCLPGVQHEKKNLTPNTSTPQECCCFIHSRLRSIFLGVLNCWN